MVISDIALWEKTGGRSGSYRRALDLDDDARHVTCGVRQTRTNCCKRRLDGSLSFRSRTVTTAIWPVTAPVLTAVARTSPDRNPSTIRSPRRVTVPESQRQARSVTLLVLFILAVIWAAVLLPPYLQNRSESRPADSISSFQQPTVRARARRAGTVGGRRVA